MIIDESEDMQTLLEGDDNATVEAENDSLGSRTITQQDWDAGMKIAQLFKM